MYQFNEQSVLVIGGAYSVDKNYRLQMGYNWYSSEQPSEEIKDLDWKKTKDLPKVFNNQ